MSAPHRSPGEIAGLAAMPEGDAERAAFEAHAAGCATCGAELRRAARLASLLGSLATPPPASQDALRRTRARVHALLAAEPRSRAAPARSPVAGLAVAAAVVVSVVVALSLSGPAISVPRVLLAITTVGVAALLPSFAMRSERDAIAATGTALGLSLLLGRLDYTEFPYVAGHTVGCLQVELVVAALPLMAVLAFSRSAGRRLGALQSAATGAAGALAGQGVLLTTCAADESALHVLAFHVAGVALASVIGGGLGALAGRRTA